MVILTMTARLHLVMSQPMQFLRLAILVLYNLGRSVTELDGGQSYFRTMSIYQQLKRKLE